MHGGSHGRAWTSGHPDQDKPRSDSWSLRLAVAADEFALTAADAKHRPCRRTSAGRCAGLAPRRPPSRASILGMPATRCSTDGLGVAGGSVAIAEPDLEQSWLWTTPNRQALGIAAVCDAAPPNSDVYAVGNTNLWFADESPFAARAGTLAASSRPDPGDVAAQRRAHRPSRHRLRRQPRHQAAFPEHRPAPATSSTPTGRTMPRIEPTAVINPMFGHGTGTLSILAGKDIDGESFGAAANLEIVPIRVANWVVLFKQQRDRPRPSTTSTPLCGDEATRVHVVTMSMGGIASRPGPTPSTRSTRAASSSSPPPATISATCRRASSSIRRASSASSPRAA